MRSPIPTTLRLAGAVSLLLAVGVVAGCTSENRDAPATVPTSPVTSTPTTAAPTSTADPHAATVAAVLAAYRGFWADVVVAGRSADWQSPHLADHAVGAPVTAVRDTLRQLRQAGLVARGTIRVAPTITSLAATTAKLSDCQDLTRFLKYDAKTGALRDKPSGKRYLAVATLSRLNGQWKITELAQAVRVCGNA
jgi:hypothetical protein